MVQKSDPEPKRPRGRPRGFDADEALAQAMATFWRHGFSATSLDILSEATGLNRPSLYGAFGDKHALYLLSLQRYTAEAVAAMDKALAGRPLREGLRRIYEFALKMYYPPDEAARGCLLVGTAATEAGADEDIRQHLGDALRAFDAVFEARMQRALAEGELAPGADAAVLARIASAVLHSLALRSRAGDRRAELSATAAAAVDLICGPAPR